MRVRLACVSLVSAFLLVAGAGCGMRSRYGPSPVLAPARRPSSGVYSKNYRGPRRARLERTGWYHVVDAKDRGVVGYMEECSHPTEKSKQVKIVYDKFLKKVGFVTPHGVVYRYNEDGSSKRMGLVPSKGIQGYLLGIDGPVDYINPLRVERDENALVVPKDAWKKKEEAPAR
jgi:hypothetical protein